MDETLQKAMEQAWAAIRASEEARRKGEESLRESLRGLQESQGKTEESLRGLQESQGKTEESLRELGDHLRRADGNFNTKWGHFLENFVEGDVVRLLREGGMKVDTLVPGLVVRKDDDPRPRAEHDLVASNGKEAVVVETKTTLGREDVAIFLHKLGQFKENVPMYKSHAVHGALAFMRVERAGDPKKIRRKKDERTGRFERSPWDGILDKFKDKGAFDMAEEAGLFMIQSPGGARKTSRLLNKKGFKPKKF